MAKKNLACEWLDRLLVSRPLKDFRIPGSQNGSAPKMKVFIHCEEIKPWSNTHLSLKIHFLISLNLKIKFLLENKIRILMTSNSNGIIGIS